MANYGKLILLSTEQTEQVFPLTAAQMTVGRETTNDIVLADKKASRLHARLECTSDTCVIIDADSANGIFVDGQPVKRARLQSGNLIKIGDSLLRFEQAQPAQSVKSPLRPGKKSSSARRLLDQFLDDMEQGSLESGPSAQAAAFRDSLRHIPHLVITTPQDTWEFRLKDQESWTIGRRSTNDIVIDHQKVSQQHARIEREQDRFIIRDLSSSNGTWLGRQRIETHILGYGDTLNIGHAQLTFKDTNQVELLYKAEETTSYSPVIVVPGLCGSTLWQGSEQIWPNLQTVLRTPEKLHYKTNDPLRVGGIVGGVVIIPKLMEIAAYSRIGDYLESSLHYTRGKNLLEFSYDWRADVRTAAQQLAKMVDQWAVQQPITIIAHSLGGLVSRYYIDCLGGDRRVGRLILIGAPNHGTPYIFTNLLPDRLSHLRTPVIALSGALGKKLIQAFMTFPASYQLLPTYPAIVDQNGRPLDLYNDERWWPAQNSRALVQSGRDLHRDLSKQATVSTICIFGYGVDTLTRIKILAAASGAWKDLELITSKDGDGLMPTESTILAGAEIHPVQQSHNELYVDEDVLMRLKYELINQ